MSNRVNVNVNVNDMTRSGLRNVRNSVRNLTRQLPDDHRVDVTLNDNGARIRARALRRALRQLSEDDVNVRVNLTGDAFNRSGRIRRALTNLPDGVRVNIIPDTDSNSGRRWLTRTRNALTAPARQLGAFVGGTLSDGVGQGLSGGFRAAGPIAAAAFATAAVAALAVVGAALSGILVTALGAAFVGIGGVSAAMSDKVQAKWKTTLASLKKDFQSVGEPMIPVLESALDTIESMAHRAAPQLKKAIEDTLPATEKFVDSLLKGFESFGKAAFKPVMDAWNVFAPVFGEEWDEFMDELGNSFGRMADLVREHPTEIAAALDVVFEALDLLVDTVTFFGKTWVFMMQNAGDAVGFLMKNIALLTDAFFAAIDGMLAGVEKFAGVVGLDGPIKSARRNLEGLRNDAVGKLTGMANSAFGLDDALNKANRKRTLQADINSWSAKMQRARSDLKRTTDQKARAKLTADISDLNAKIKRARGELARLNGATAWTYVNVTYRPTNSYVDALSHQNRAHGGVTGTMIPKAAAGGVRGNLTMVGEAGPELVQLPSGSRVRTNPDTRRLMGASGGGANRTILELRSSGSKIDDMLLEILRKAIKVKGGDVQLVLGRN